MFRVSVFFYLQQFFLKDVYISQIVFAEMNLQIKKTAITIASE